jgi:D-cysteine desulfhydrase family pyridoxal phosphate-dependent enzyme
VTGSRSRALDALQAIPALELAHYPTPIEELAKLRAALGYRGRLLIKRDDAISFAFGGNKVRKAEVIGADAVRSGADTLLTIGAIQSNHARVTAATAARLGLRCILVVHGAPSPAPTGNALLDSLMGAELHVVDAREQRAPTMKALADRLRQQGRKPYEIPLGASCPLGAAAIARAVGELRAQGMRPDVIIHATSSGGTQAGLVAGCELFGVRARVVGISADDSAQEIQAEVRRLLRGLAEQLDEDGDALSTAGLIEVDDRFVGPGYGVPSAASTEAIGLLARTEALFLDPVYTAKAMAGLLDYVRSGRLSHETILFWHTGGLPALFA